jgi:hypothetical protein
MVRCETQGNKSCVTALTDCCVTGCIIRKELVEEGKKLSDTVTELIGEEKRQFLDFAASMLHWLPEKRKTAKELLQHPFLEDLKIS